MLLDTSGVRRCAASSGPSVTAPRWRSRSTRPVPRKPSKSFAAAAACPTPTRRRSRSSSICAHWGPGRSRPAGSSRLFMRSRACATASRRPSSCSSGTSGRTASAPLDRRWAPEVVSNHLRHPALGAARGEPELEGLAPACELAHVGEREETEHRGGCETHHEDRAPSEEPVTRTIRAEDLRRNACGRDRRAVVRERETEDREADERERLGPRGVLHGASFNGAESGRSMSRRYQAQPETESIHPATKSLLLRCNGARSLGRE